MAAYTQKVYLKLAKQPHVLFRINVPDNRLFEDNAGVKQ